MNPARSLPLRPLVAVAAVAAGFSAAAQESPYELDQAGWFVRVGAFYQTGMSVSVNRLAQPTPAAGVYDNGFVKPDINAGVDGLTWNWGYEDSAQIVEGTLELSKLNGLGGVQQLDQFGDSNLFGPEVLVGFEFFRFDIGKRDALFGFELGFRFADYSGSDRGTASSTVQRVTDRYDLGGIVPPLPPYSGTYATAGPLISLNPIEQPTLVADATSTLSSELTADFYTARFGAWMMVPITDKFRAGFSAGFTSTYAYGTAEYTQQDTFSNPLFPTITENEGGHQGDWLPGVYFQARAAYWFREWVGVYLGAEWSHNGNLHINTDNYQANFDFGSTFGANGGVQFSF